MLHTSGASKYIANAAMFLITSRNFVAHMATLRAGVWHGSNFGLGNNLEGSWASLE